MRGNQVGSGVEGKYIPKKADLPYPALSTEEASDHCRKGEETKEQRDENQDYTVKRTKRTVFII